jgi:hypothetical protein
MKRPMPPPACAAGGAMGHGRQPGGTHGLPDGHPERVTTCTPVVRHDKILKAFGGHTEPVTDSDRSALERAF